MQNRNNVPIILAFLVILLIFTLLMSGCGSTATPGSPHLSSASEETHTTYKEPKTFEDDDFRYIIHYDTESVTIATCLTDKASLYHVILPDNVEGYPVTEIGRRAFYEFFDLRSITLPETLTTIGEAAFFGCYQLTEILLPESLETIHSQAFYGCSSLKNIRIPSGVTSISDEAVFFGCTGIESYTVDDNNPAYTSLDGVLFSKDMTEILMYPPAHDSTSYTIPDGITSISNDAFSSCTYLLQVTIPDSVTDIGDWAFYDCENIALISLPDSITSIGDSAFQGCSDLFLISLPQALTSIPKQCFAGCSNLQEVVIPNGVTEIGDKAFYECRALQWVFIPSSVEVIGNSVFVASHILNGIYCGAAEKPEKWPEHWSGSTDNMYYWGESSQLSKMLESFLSLAISYYKIDLYEKVINGTRFLIHFTDRMETEDISLLYALRVDAFNAMEDYDSSLKDLDRLYQFMKDNTEQQETYNLADILLQRGNLLEILGRHEEAIESYLSYLKLAPDDFDMYEAIIDYYFRESKDIEGIMLILDAALENHPSPETYTFRLSYFEDLKLYEQAIADCTQALETGTESDYFYLKRAYYRMLEEDYHEAIEDATSSIMTAAVQNPETYLLRADLRSLMGDYENALHDYLSVLEISGNTREYEVNPTIYGKVGIMHLELGNPLEAISSFYDYYSRVPFEELEITYLIAMGDAYYRYGNIDSAILSYEVGLSLYPESPIPYQKLGDMYTEKEDYTSALEYYRTMINLVQEDPELSEIKDYGDQKIAELEMKGGI